MGVKRYGYIRRKGAPSLYFHMNNLSVPKACATGVCLMPSNCEVVRTLPGPKVRAGVAFVLSEGPRGPLANPWCYKQEYMDALSEFQSWNSVTRYRVLVTYSRTDAGDPYTYVEWGGEFGVSLEEICKRYPRGDGDLLKEYCRNRVCRKPQLQKLDGEVWKDVTVDPRPAVLVDKR